MIAAFAKGAVKIVAGLLLAGLLMANLSLVADLTFSGDRLDVVVKQALQDGEFSAQKYPTQDTFSECGILLMERLRDHNFLLKTIDSRWIRPGPLPCAALEVLLGIGPHAYTSLSPPSSYFNYQFGSRHLLALVLSFSDVPTARSIYKFLSYGTIVLLLIAAWRNNRVFAVALLPVGLFLLFVFAQSTFADNLAHAPGYFVGFFILALLLWTRETFSYFTNRLLLFAFLGVMITYFDVMSGALPVMLSLSILSNHLFYVTRQVNHKSPINYWAIAIGEAAAICACFIIAYATLTATRLGLLSIVYPNIWTMYLTGLHTRMDNIDGQTMLHTVDIVQKLWSKRSILVITSWSSNTGLTIGASLLLGAAAAWVATFTVLAAVLWRRHQISLVGTDVFIILGAALVVLVWYLMFPNHTFVHAFFIVRIIALPASYGFVALILILQSLVGRRSAPSL